MYSLHPMGENWENAQTGNVLVTFSIVSVNETCIQFIWLYLWEFTGFIALTTFDPSNLPASCHMIRNAAQYCMGLYKWVTGQYLTYRSGVMVLGYCVLVSLFIVSEICHRNGNVLLINSWKSNVNVSLV